MTRKIEARGRNDGGSRILLWDEEYTAYQELVFANTLESVMALEALTGVLNGDREYGVLRKVPGTSIQRVIPHVNKATALDQIDAVSGNSNGITAELVTRFTGPWLTLEEMGR